IIRLGFDPAAPSRFAVFVLVRDDGITRVEIFSSETGRWTSKESEWGDLTSVVDHNGSLSLFFGGTLHLTTHDSSVIMVDAEGNTWRKIRMPLTVADTSDYGYIGQSQGRLYAMHMDYTNGNRQLSVWVLEDYASGQWTLKHTASMSELIGHDEVCTFVAFGPECKSIFFQINGLNDRLVSYDVENRTCRVVFCFGNSHYDLRCKPYIPSYIEWLSDGCKN
uniref:F-box protein At3g26010-like beta-propeller domain-containing protein n=1 Tax=Aegilops tauschii subsp. strangulata TaxID=200361 RepID=A0A452ZUC5_AEGTS